ncbi:gamma-glutamylcyclotransferase isoform X2 [Phalacrocorax aristotelis]|uniref:gamma-glutamylcyclotransferase isoform X2 n=1 Tax=Phalacrocorax aristotelis TaxID=126867 RepID=UPI003F4CA5AF
MEPGGDTEPGGGGFLYYAYGSNLLRERLLLRNPSAALCALARLQVPAGSGGGVVWRCRGWEAAACGSPVAPVEPRVRAPRGSATSRPAWIRLVAGAAVARIRGGVLVTLDVAACAVTSRALGACYRGYPQPKAVFALVPPLQALSYWAASQDPNAQRVMSLEM